MKRLCSFLLIATALGGCAKASAPSLAGIQGNFIKASGVVNAAPRASFSVDGVAGAALVPGKPAEWSFGFLDAKSGQPLTRFDAEHGKAMHLVVVSADLDTFTHIHPDLDAASGKLNIGINQASNDPDNQGTLQVITKPGPFFLFGELTPSGQGEQLVRIGANAVGQTSPVPLVLDSVGADGVASKFFTADGRVGKQGDAYHVNLKVSKSAGASPMLDFSFTLQAAASGAYKPVTDLTPWLGMPGHAILVSQAGQRIEDKVFRHLHAGMGMMKPMAMGESMDMSRTNMSGPTIKFMAMDKDLPPAGIYKIWGQFQRQGRVLTFPFVIQL
jgi:hypothetical protein